MTSDVLTDAARRAGSYKGLSACFSQPDEDLLRVLGELDGQACGLFGPLADALVAAGDLETLKVDRARLIVGPFSLLAAPYGAVYLEDNAFMGESTMDARELYQQEGLEVAMKEAPDHIVMELEFMAFLVLREMEEAGRDAPQQAEQFRQKQADFLDRHLGRWVGRFTDQVEKHAQTEFYKVLARVTRQFVACDCQSLGIASV